ncbi:ATP-dependent (S)-NAD(P)H-hydrate dehydratase [Anthonomus grandis grandis]|uniref:ATP-dependent (S)-NAD(P)H-hydrate dehydratase n=1 Tax=Anthonomus grandis grandis TaxID=2921223 RepID=UPI002165F1BA|nr:ATP-dependent (S)-NAD(P)H-hydrate dehydratase [Anthonomus grandis grandis]
MAGVCIQSKNIHLGYSKIISTIWYSVNLLQFASYSAMSKITVSDCALEERAKCLAPPLTNGKHKGQAGRIGVFGGSIEFTGAPYFSSIAALKVGADLSYVFTIKDAAFVIKSYSPELMVLPFLDDSDVENKISPWLERVHVALLGPGLGRLESTEKVFQKIVSLCRLYKKPLIIDADGLFFVAKNPDIIKNYPATIILTPNKMEFQRIVGQNQEKNLSKLEQAKQFLEQAGSNITIFSKDADDEIITLGKSVKISGGGSGRRCGGQGDMLGGSMATFLAWALEKKWDPAVACYAASKLTRESNAKAFSKHGRSMLVTDMIQEIPEIFKEHFEIN